MAMPKKQVPRRAPAPIDWAAALRNGDARRARQTPFLPLKQ